MLEGRGVDVITLSDFERPDEMSHWRQSLIPYHMVSEPRQRKHRTEVRKLSRHKREVRISAGELNPELDFICPHCDGVFSLYNSRHELHLRTCKRRIAQTTRLFQKPPLPSPLPFENEAFLAPAATGE